MDTAPLNASPHDRPRHRSMCSAYRGRLGRLADQSVARLEPTCPPGSARGSGLHDRHGRQARGRRDRRGARVDLPVPVLLAIAILIRRDSPGPVLFRQRRCGRHGRPFQIWKFRTMYQDAEARVHELEATEPGRGRRALQDRGRPADHEARRDPAPHPPRRAAPALQRAQGRDEPGRSPTVAGARFGAAPEARPGRLRPPSGVPSRPHRRLAGRPGQTRSTPSTSSTSTSITSRTGRSAATSSSSPARCGWCSRN